MTKIILVFRTRPETIEAGTVVLVGTNSSKIIKEASNLIENLDIYLKMSRSINLYGDGFVSKYIVDILKMNEL
ncbi:MAG: UDP-N-acetylglucosamine 2-epimerase [Bacteroidetes bacterium]|nr:UDP-N-acetylglucosamine 2-epimerase [Bacteroidota bacterium]